MRARSMAVIPLAALVGCTLLTEIPDDAASGGASAARDGGTSGPRDGAPADRDVDSGGGAGAETGTTPARAVALDAIGPDARGAGGPDKASPLVWSHTTSGENRALFVNVIIDADPDSSVALLSVKYESTPLTLLGVQHSNNKEAGYAALWGLANPPVGPHSVSVEFTGAPTTVLAGSISFTGVDQTTPFRNVTKTAGGGAVAQASVPSAAGNMVIAAVVGACTIAPSDGAKGWLRNVTCAHGGGNGAGAAFAGAPTVNITYGIEQDWWGIVAADVNAAP